MELKTLNDLDKLDASDFGILESNETVLVSELRQEVIKWYLHLNDCPSGIKDCRYCIGTQMFMQKFFNLTEEDLK